ncbi:hypothetical protein ACFW1J_25790 [Priestia aryabhattai]|uniref:hypothetical protein n=1 Tax=Priestia TaxID=2800373 RepID=UPI00207A9B57|nr:hypothetical protein [Priestia megaterium]USL39629.1 hypothetical protein LIT34_30320 [Priestia megaterium]
MLDAINKVNEFFKAKNITLLIESQKVSHNIYPSGILYRDTKHVVREILEGLCQK